MNKSTEESGSRPVLAVELSDAGYPPRVALVPPEDFDRTSDLSQGSMALQSHGPSEEGDEGDADDASEGNGDGNEANGELQKANGNDPDEDGYKDAETLLRAQPHRIPDELQVQIKAAVDQFAVFVDAIDHEACCENSNF